MTQHSDTRPAVTLEELNTVFDRLLAAPRPGTGLSRAEYEAMSDEQHEAFLADTSERLTANALGYAVACGADTETATLAVARFMRRFRIRLQYIAAQALTGPAVTA